MNTTQQPLPADEFVEEIKGIRDQAFKDISAGKYGTLSFLETAEAGPKKPPEIVFLMQLGVYPEFRETQILARQLQRLDDIDLVFRVGKQIADEAKHAKVLIDQLKAWDVDPFAFWHEPIYQWSAAFDYMDKLATPVEYLAAANFVGEGLFVPTILIPITKHDPENFRVYTEHILPDEPYHITLGRDVILKYCTTFEMQERVRKVSQTIAKQYCIGYEAATKFATRCSQTGLDPGVLRDGRVVLP